MPKTSRLRLFFLVSALFLSFATTARTKPADSDVPVEIPFQKFVLKNGLRLIVHEDHKTPIVAVNVWYHVGSKDERAGKSGFAHLFEHIMFNGSESFNDDWFKLVDKLGGSSVNGTTNEDRTNYFQNVPSSALDTILFMESDRMGHLLGVLTKAKLDEQRKVVQNEKRQHENAPYGKVPEIILRATYPDDHPYAHTVIGSMDDLNAASLSDVHEWFKTYYGPSNAVVVVSGDVKPDDVHKRVEKFFGDIPPGPPLVRAPVWVAQRTETTRQIMQDRVPQSRLYMVWNAPELAHIDLNYLDLACSVLSESKSSRLYNRLVYRERIASGVSCYMDTREIASQVFIDATVAPGVETSVVEAAIFDELDRLRRDGPTKKELDRILVGYRADFIRNLERIGGFYGKSDLLASYEIYFGDPGFYKEDFRRYVHAKTDDVRDAVRKWMSQGVHLLEVQPFPPFTASAKGVERKTIPAAGTPPAPMFPKVEEARLKNGLRILLARRTSLPLVQMHLFIPSGYSADPKGKAGLATLVANVLNEGTAKHDSLELENELALLGTSLSAGAGLDHMTVSLNSLKEKLDPSLELFAEVLLRPTFPQKEVERLRKEQADGILREKSSPSSMANRVFSKLLYGEGHPYAIPFTGSGYEDDVRSIGRDDIVSYYQKWFHPDHARLVVAGDITMKELKGRMESLLKDWEPSKVVPPKIPAVSKNARGAVYIMDRPGSEQSTIMAGYLIAPVSYPEDFARSMMNNVLGGKFTSRLNMNLREDKGWSYGVRSVIDGTQAQRPFYVRAPVQTDKTSEAMQEILKELRQYQTNQPITEKELSDTKDEIVLGLAGDWETVRSVASSLGFIANYSLPTDHYQRYPSAIRNTSLQATRDMARTMIDERRLVWLIVGDREKIQGKIAKLNLGEVFLIDVNGKILKDIAPVAHHP